MPADGKKAVGIVVGLMVFGLIAAFLMPVAINAIAGDETTTITQNTTDTTEVQPGLEITLDSTDDTNDTATYTVNASGSTATTSAIAVGSNETVTVDGIDVTLAPKTVNPDSATTDVSYPTDYGWGSGASAMWAILPVILVLAVFLYIVGMALNRSYI